MKSESTRTRRHASAASTAPAALAAFAALLLAAPLSGQARVRADVDTTLVTVGDRITLTVAVDHAADATVRWPDSLDLSPFEVLEAGLSAPVPTEDGMRSGARLTLTAFDLGELVVPSLEIQVEAADGSTETLRTDRFGVEVASVGADETGDIRDIRGPLSIPLSRVRVAAGILLPMLLLALAYWAYRRYRGRGEGGDAEPRLAALERPAHEVALEALAELEASPALERGQVKEYHIALADILRRYVEGRYRVAALEMTTWEVIDGLERASIDREFREGLQRLLEPCDLVKFAKVRPGPEESHGLLVLGRGLVERTAPRMAPEPPDGVSEEEAA